VSQFESAIQRRAGRASIASNEAGMRTQLETKWIIPVVAVAFGLGGVLIPWWSWYQRQQDCIATLSFNRGQGCFEPQVDWVTGVIVGVATYFILAGFVVAQRALTK
jgi:hypothetical protein